MVFEFSFEKLSLDFMLVGVNANVFIETASKRDILFRNLEKCLEKQIPLCLVQSFAKAEKHPALIAEVERRKGYPIVKAIVAYVESEALMEQLKEAYFKEGVPR